ncbi:MAG: hypothetical protein LBT00_02625 [Spirochaetaceae bacterium]|nr:hypothetical protein [Spirochaetaceae bacterium]
MKSKLFAKTRGVLAGVSVMVPLLTVAFAVVLAGCASAPKEGPAADINAAAELSAAEKLAADINALEAGKATASGDAVTLTGGVRLENALTVPPGVTLEVPPGVTLDLTQDGAALALGNGATLTVNGTVNAKAEGINIDSAAASPATIKGSGTISLKSNGRLLNIGGNKKLILDGGTLVGLPDNSDTLVRIEGGEFALKSGKITGNTIVTEGGTPGGGVSIDGDSGVFTMTGGEISGNNAREAGGVAISGGTFIMKDGTILGNIGGYMGGVSVGQGATFIMEGGEIFGNTAEDFGGVGIVNGTFTLKGGRIQGSTDSDGFAKNTGKYSAALRVMNNSTAKWDTGGAYTKGGVSQTGGSDIVQLESNGSGGTDDTLIAVPGK